MKREGLVTVRAEPDVTSSAVHCRGKRRSGFEIPAAAYVVVPENDVGTAGMVYPPIVTGMSGTMNSTSREEPVVRYSPDQSGRAFEVPNCSGRLSLLVQFPVLICTPPLRH